MNQKPVIILGGGLWGGLLAYRWQQLYPDVDFLLVEKEPHFGGNHTWCFHHTDLKPQSFSWLSPFIAHRWEKYQVKFPAFERTIHTPYHALTSEKFHQVLINALPARRRLLSTAFSLEEAQIVGSWVIDARGILNHSPAAYQKFVGLELELQEEHQLEHPVLMDVNVPQLDGFRFIYTLPLGPRTVLIEDTRYSNSAELDPEIFKQEILSFVSERSWRPERIVREERGVLPLPLSPMLHRQAPDVQLAGLFHDTTGYSLPDAVRVIDRLLKTSPEKDSFHKVLSCYRKEREGDRRFFRMLNRFMFRAAEDEERYRMLQFFYRHSPKLIGEFYSGELSALSKLRFFMGRPPVSILKAIREITA